MILSLINGGLVRSGVDWFVDFLAVVCLAILFA